MKKKIKIGVHINQTNMNFSGIRKVAKAAEESGFDAVTIMDHLRAWEHHGGQRTSNMLECWTTLGALAMETKKLKIGPFVTCTSYRNPAFIAKMAACIDHISGGRLKLGLGAGWGKPEAEEYGIHFGSPKERVERLHESILIIRKMWTEEEACFKGKHYQINGAVCYPGPSQKPIPPIYIGGYGNKMLRLSAELADGWNTFGSLERYENRLNILKGYCEEIDRNWKELDLSWGAWAVVADDQKEITKFLRPSQPLDDFINNALVGTPEHCGKKLSSFISLGVTDFELIFPDTFYPVNGTPPQEPSLMTLKRFAEEIIPYIKK